MEIFDQSKDYCSYFPDRWVVWVSLYKWEIVYIGDLCKGHDENCSFHKFVIGLMSRRVVGSLIIATGGAVGCWAKYTKKMIGRV